MALSYTFTKYQSFIKAYPPLLQAQDAAVAGQQNYHNVNIEQYSLTLYQAMIKNQINKKVKRKAKLT